MPRRSLIALLTAGALAGLAGAAAAAPNILLISVDTLRADRLSSYGYNRDTSPRIDALLARGVRFSRARTVEPLTAPALASMLTSLPPHEHGSTRNGLRVRDNLTSFSKILGLRGYETAAFVGNWTLQDRISGLAEHFETYESILNRRRWFGLVRSEASASDLNEIALDWLDEHLDDKPGKPFLLWVHYVEPHAPYRLHPAVMGQLGLQGTTDATGARNRYDSEVAFVDLHIGRLLDEVAERVPMTDTVVVFVADHGESLGEHGYWGHGRHLYDATLWIPMGLVWEGTLEPAVRDEPALITDLAPTLMSVAGLEPTEFFQGLDWLPVLRGEAEFPEGRVTWYQAHRGAVTGKPEDGTRPRTRGLLEVGRIEGEVKEILRVTNDRRWLFDLAADPSETDSKVPITSGPSPELAAWLEKVRDGLALADDLPPPSLSEDDLDALRDLGYID